MWEEHEGLLKGEVKAMPRGVIDLVYLISTPLEQLGTGSA